MTTTTPVSADADTSGQGLPPWLVPAGLLLLTSVVAAAGALLSPRFKGSSDLGD